MNFVTQVGIDLAEQDDTFFRCEVRLQILALPITLFAVLVPRLQDSKQSPVLVLGLTVVCIVVTVLALRGERQRGR